MAVAPTSPPPPQAEAEVEAEQLQSSPTAAARTLLPSPPLSPSVPIWTQLELRSSEIRPNPADKVPIMSWPEVKQIIAEGQYELFRRNPADRAVYKTWCRATIAKYGSLTAYVMAERLHWTPLESSDAENGPQFKIKDPSPFADAADRKILFNDWPYGTLEGSIVHLVVWLKSRIPSDPETGLPTPECKTVIDDFVRKTFTEKWLNAGNLAPEEDVIWLKVPQTRQTVAGLEHIHVLMRSPPQELLEEWTGESGPSIH